MTSKEISVVARYWFVAILLTVMGVLKFMQTHQIKPLFIILMVIPWLAAILFMFNSKFRYFAIKHENASVGVGLMYLLIFLFW